MADEPAGTKAIITGESPGKYYRIDVPDWTTETGTGDGTFTSDGVAHSYLRIGANPGGTEAGDDLVVLVKNSGLDAINNSKDSDAEKTRKRQALRAKASTPYETTFIDDERTRDDDSATKDARKQVTNKLVTQTGWRDHADGNRITTTRGDKIEVIRGNYKLLVLGRQDEPENGAFWEASGGLIQDNDIAPGSISSISYEKDPWGGTWKVIEEFGKADVVNRYHGNVTDEFYGDSVISVVGSESPDDLVAFDSDGNSDPDQTKKHNPSIVERTWASKIESYTGSSKTRVPSITEWTWAGSIQSNTTAHSIDENVECSGQIRTKTIAANVAELTIAPVEELYIGPKEEGHIGTLGAFTVGAVAELFVGVRGEVLLGKGYSLVLGGTKEYALEDGQVKLVSDELALKNIKRMVLRHELIFRDNKSTMKSSEKYVIQLSDSLETSLNALKANIGGPPTGNPLVDLNAAMNALDDAAL